MSVIWGYFFIALIFATTGYVFYAGDREARIAIVMLVVASALTVLTVYFSGQYYEYANGLVAMVDFLLLAAFLWQSLVSRRYWILGLPALQAIVCIIHLAKFLAPEILPRAYVAGQGHWSYYQIGLIVMAAHMHRVRRKTLQNWLRGRRASRDGVPNV